MSESETSEGLTLEQEEANLRQEVREQIESDLSGSQGQLDTLRHFTNQEGWKIAMALIDGQASRRERVILGEPLKGIGDGYRQEFMKGEVQGLRLIPVLIQTMIEEAEAMAEALQRELATQEEKEKDGLF
ncbi:hypothetical protein CMI37_11405 [Candidatus Pacearchaeota archaeon]|nr:hypothetical protein [Candidatus Pacearchaeota archaeon]|tara:strand:- start:1917 stop:2306 length:390 start_codon:yes stop_codon:yes gene_type:complete